MFKKACQVLISFAILVGLYAGYTRGFAALEWHVRSLRPRLAIAPVTRSESVSSREATALAAASFGPDHWTAKAPFRYYTADQGYWLFAENYTREGEDGKRLIFTPFALIQRSKDGKSLKVMTSREAVVNFDRPPDSVKPGTGSARVVHARINGEVMLRDDKGTPLDRGDDLLVRLNYAEYDEPSLTIQSAADVDIRDRDMVMTATGMRLDLRPKTVDPSAPPGTPPGFSGVKTATFLKNVDIVIQDVGSSGILAEPARGSQKGGAKTPLHLTSDAEARFDLPPPTPWTKVGPPRPPEPTLAQFSRNVVVVQGVEVPDQLNSDHLHLTLTPSPRGKAKPKPKPAPVVSAAAPSASAADSEAAPEAEGGPLSELSLREAVATGHAVWLQSPSQGMKGRGNRLVHTTPGQGQPDVTFFQADPNAQIEVEKVDLVAEGPNKGKVSSINTIHAANATITKMPGQGSEEAKVVAAGPGLLEARPGPDRPVDRTAEWQDRLEMQTRPDPAGSRRVVSLFGHPKLVQIPDPAPPGRPAPDGPRGETILLARDRIDAFFKPKPPAPPVLPPLESTTAPTPAIAAVPPTPASKIEYLTAYGDVHLDAPGQHLIAHDRLDAKFEDGQLAAVAPTQPAAGPATPAAPTPVAPPAPISDAKAVAKAKSTPPPSRAEAGQVFARLGPKAGGQGHEIREVRLRRNASYQQDPAPGKTVGTEAVGEAIDLLRQDPSKPGAAPARPDDPQHYRVVVFNRDPAAVEPKTRTLARVGPAAPAVVARPARVVHEDLNVEGPMVVLDQLAHKAWVSGAGKLIQMSKRGGLGLLEGEAEAPTPAPTAGATPEAEKVPVTITWKRRMEFDGEPRGADGNPTDPSGKPWPAQAEFYGDVHAETEDSTIDSQQMLATMDRPVSFVRRNKAPDAPREPKVQLATLDCLEDVHVVSVKRDPKTRAVLERQVVEGQDVQYERATGRFRVNGAGIVYLYALKKDAKAGGGTGDGGLGGGLGLGLAPSPDVDVRIIRVAGPGRPNIAPRSAARTPSGRTLAPAVRAPQVAKPTGPPWVLTRIVFRDRLEGLFGSGRLAANSPNGRNRQADIFGGVTVIHAPVADEMTTIDPDRPPVGSTRLNSDYLRVITEPPPRGTKAPARNFLHAEGRAMARTDDTTIQGDQIRYDSGTELFKASAVEGAQVRIAKQEIKGQPATQSSARAMTYNRRTGQKEMVDPDAMQFIDFKTGQRNLAVKPEGEKAENKPKRPNFRLPPRSDKELKGFNSR